MANMLRRVYHVAFVLALPCLASRLHTQEKPESDEVRRKVLGNDKPSLKLEKPAKVPQTIAEINAEIASLEQGAVEIQKYAMSKWICSQDFARTHQELELARAELKRLDGQRGQSERVATLKKAIEGREKVLADLDEVTETVPVLLDEMKKRTIDLQTLRERLAGKPQPAASEKKESK
jgi:hypothetical protein